MLISSAGHQGNPMTASKIKGGGLVDQDRTVRLDRQNPSPGLSNLPHRADPDRGNIEPHILLRLGHLDHGKTTRRAEFSSPLNTTVRPLDRLHSKHRFPHDDHRLADIQPPQ